MAQTGLRAHNIINSARFVVNKIVPYTHFVCVYVYVGKINKFTRLETKESSRENVDTHKLNGLIGQTTQSCTSLGRKKHHSLINLLATSDRDVDASFPVAPLPSSVSRRRRLRRRCHCLVCSQLSCSPSLLANLISAFLVLCFVDKINDKL